MSTIKEVAKKAGVSTATVSRVLNGNYPVSKETYEKVTDAVKSLNYRTNVLAKSLKMKKTYIIGLVVPDISNAYFMDIARSIEDVISERNYTLMVCSSDEDNDKEIRLLKALNDKRVDCVVLASSLNTEEPIQELIDQGLNLIMLDRFIENLNLEFVLENNEQSSFEIVEYGIQMGHKKIAIVNGKMNVSTSIERFQGAKRALETYGLKLPESYVVQGDYSRRSAYEMTKNMLIDNKESMPTLIFSANNIMTEGIMIGVKELGLEIPEDISLISYGDISLPELVIPSLSVVKQNPRAIGKKVGETLLERLASDNFLLKFEKTIILTEIQKKDSVKKIN